MKTQQKKKAFRKVRPVRFPNQRFGNPEVLRDLVAHLPRRQAVAMVAESFGRDPRSITDWISGAKRMPFYIAELIQLRRLEEWNVTREVIPPAGIGFDPASITSDGRSTVVPRLTVVGRPAKAAPGLPVMSAPGARYGNAATVRHYTEGFTLRELAKSLRRDERTVRDWLSGKTKLPHWVEELTRLRDLQHRDIVRQMVPPVRVPNAVPVPVAVPVAVPAPMPVRRFAA